jgi:hypothetical protein
MMPAAMKFSALKNEVMKFHLYAYLSLQQAYLSTVFCLNYVSLAGFDVSIGTAEVVVTRPILF